VILRFAYKTRDVSKVKATEAAATTTSLLLLLLLLTAALAVEEALSCVDE
jgi:hypothetical protein